MKNLYKIILVTLIFVVFGAFYFLRYTTFKHGSFDVLYYNPFTIDEVGFRDNYEKALDFLDNGDTTSAKKHFANAIKYKGTHNEKTRERIYSCGNALWEYKQDKLLKFSNCYENLGMLDSAMTCLEPALYNLERYDYPVENQFFRLAIKKYGRQEVISELELVLERIQKIDCFMCMDYYFEFKGVKIGVDNYDLETNKEFMIKTLTGKYCRVDNNRRS